MKKTIPIFLFLLGITLLLLEIPKQYYRHADQKLFAERGLSNYETKVTKTMEDFQSKLDSFISYMPDSSTNGIGYTKELTLQETNEVFQRLIQEFEGMTNKTPQNLIDAMKASSATSQCFTAQIFQLIKNEQFVWEVGNLEFSLPQLDVQGRIVYDTDSYKIIMIYWFCHSELDDGSFLIKQIDDASPVFDYYAAVTDEIYFSHELGYGFIFPYPVPIEYLEYDSLLRELNELSNYFWNDHISDALTIISEQEIQ